MYSHSVTEAYQIDSCNGVELLILPGTAHTSWYYPE